MTKDDNLLKKLDQSVSYIRNITDRSFDIAIVLGSGLGKLADFLEDKIIIPYSEIPNFPISTAPGHYGKLIAGKLGGKSLLCFQGRFHYYEGYNMRELSYPEFFMHQLNIKNVILTNAAGCVNPDWNVGDLMLITDHIKLTAENPLRGRNIKELGPRFFDMSDTYNQNLRNYAKKCANSLDIKLREGVYQLFCGPSFETAAEIKLARICGVSAVGMSTVPEAITANYLGMNILGISCLTNMATGILDQPLNQQEVIDAGERVKETFITLLQEIITNWPQE